MRDYVSNLSISRVRQVLSDHNNQEVRRLLGIGVATVHRRCHLRRSVCNGRSTSSVYL
jgi:hypothetical protein